MRPKVASILSLLLPILFSLFLVGLVAGCGGGGDQSGSGEKQEGKAAGKAATKEPLPKKVAIGTVRTYKDDKRRLSLRPAADTQSKKPLGFKVRQNAEITLGGEKAEPEDITEGQQAQITYVVKNDANRAIIVHLFSEEPSENDESKQPSGENKPPEGNDNPG